MVVMGSKFDQILARCDAWEESKHPRAEDGKFGSGGGATPSKAKGLAKESSAANNLGSREEHGAAYKKLKEIPRDKPVETTSVANEFSAKANKSNTLIDHLNAADALQEAADRYYQMPPAKGQPVDANGRGVENVEKARALMKQKRAHMAKAHRINKKGGHGWQL